MRGTAAQVVLLCVSLPAIVLSGLRWLRVAQREHYLVGSVLRFARRWWSLGPNRLLGGAGVVGLVGAAFGILPGGVVASLAVLCGPLGLPVRGRSSPLTWTRRLRTLAAITAVVAAAPIVMGAAAGLWLAADVSALVAIAVPLLVEAGLALTAPLEQRLARPYVERATARLRATAPRVVAITGSYGKTSTKGYVAHLLGGTFSVVPSPRSFNNQAGLARAVNDHLVPGTEVFVAEMGTYGPGEIARMCEWIRPEIAVITAIGPVHLERRGGEERIAAAKAEILDRASVAVLNVDHPLLAALAAEAAAAGRPVRRCSARDASADVWVRAEGADLAVFVGGAGEPLATVAGLDAAPTNVACAVAVAVELGVPPSAIAERLAGLPTAAHRREVTATQGGAAVIDDTYNANPAGAAGALDLLVRMSSPQARRVVVTPGMVELGGRQDEENERFARDAAAVATDIVVVGHTNARSLLGGARSGGARVVRAATREQAVAWVSANVGPGDVVLYENDLPDHFP